MNALPFTNRNISAPASNTGPVKDTQKFIERLTKLQQAFPASHPKKPIDLATGAGAGNGHIPGKGFL